MTLHWFMPTRFRGKSIAEIRELLAPLGIRECAFRNERWGVYYEPDPDDPNRLLKAIGDVVVRPGTGAIEVWPYRGITGPELRALYGTAEQAFTGKDKPRKSSGWVYRQRGRGTSYWRSTACGPGRRPRPVVPAHRSRHAPGARPTGQGRRRWDVRGRHG